MKVGDYVRTEDGIKKVLKYTYNERYENCHCVWFDNKDCGILFTDDGVNKMKPSPNIIDLIEVGDYVNGCYVTTGNQGVGSIYIAEIDGLGLKKKLYEKDITSIVTKEQFESMKYKVGD